MLSKKYFFSSKKQYGFFTTLADPPPPGLAKDHKKYVSFSEPFPNMQKLILQSHYIGNPFLSSFENSDHEYSTVYQVIQFVRNLNYHEIQILYGNKHLIKFPRPQTLFLADGHLRYVLSLL